MTQSEGTSSHPLYLVGLLAILVVWLATRHGIGITPDSTVYIDAAHNLLSGRGLVAMTGSGEFRPLTHYPPLYSASLVLLTRIGSLLPGVSIESVARVLNSFLFGANVLMVGLAIRTCARDSYWLPVFGALLTLVAPDILGIHSFALSEGLFIFLSLTGLLSLSQFIETKQTAWLILSGAAIALGLLTRYVGVSLVTTGVLTLLILNERTWSRRCLDALSFGVISCAPMAIWAFRNIRAGGGVGDREFVFHPAGVRQIVAGLSTVSTWLLLGRVRTDLRVTYFLVEIVAAGAFVLYLLKWRRTNGFVKGAEAVTGNAEKPEARQPVSPVLTVLLVFNVSYVLFLIFTASFIDADSILDDRALVPVHVTGIIMVCGFAWIVSRSFRETAALRITFFAVAIFLLGSYSIRAATWFMRTRPDGQGYASRAWTQSETIKRVKTLPPGIPIYSNGYEAIYYLAQRPAIYVPEKIKHGTGRSNRDYAVEVERMGNALTEREGRLIYFNTLPERWFLPPESELKEMLKLRTVETCKDGSIYADAER